MKFLIWFGCFFLNAIITIIINSNGFILGGVPTALLFLGCYFLAKTLCKKWDKHKENKLVKKKSNDKLAELFAEAFVDAAKNSREKDPIVFKGQRPNEEDYGYSETNPICSSTLAGTDVYLSKLRTVDGKKFTWQRLDGVRADCNGTTDVGMDKYQLNLDNQPYKILYIVPYVAEATNAPYGLTLLNETESKEPMQSTETEQYSEPESKENICKKCGNPLLPTQTFCSHCGKKIKVQKDKTTLKKKIKKIIFIIIALILVGFLIAGIWAGVVAYQEKQDSYDLTTGYHWYDSDSWAYSYSLSNTEEKTLTDSYLLYENYYIRMVIHGDAVYVSEKGIYEFNNGNLITQTEDGEKNEYISYDGFLIKDTNFYDEIIPRKDTFDLELIKDFSDGTKEKLSFSKDGTYTISNSLGKFEGKYKRNGYLIEGVCDDITGSRTWLVYKDKLTDSFFEQDRGNSDRLRYEFFKYLKTKKPDEHWLYYHKYVTDYEEQHPITIK